MNGDARQRIKGTISRRKFAGKSVVAVIALGAAGITGYSILNADKAKIYLNYHRMGHCAPAVIKSLLDINGEDDPDLARFAGGMAGGIAGPDMECGAFTAPVMFLGFQKGLPEGMDEKIQIIRQVQSYFNEFNRHNGSTICSTIRRKDEDGCWKAVSGFNKSFLTGLQNTAPPPAGSESSWKMIICAFEEKEFHCAHSTLRKLEKNIGINRKLYDVSWPYLGGIAMLNRTCGALTAGVMALSSSLSGIENSFLKVARMNKMLKEDDRKAMSDETNEFNKAINAATELGTWFRREFGSAGCYDICGCNFSRTEDVRKYQSRDYMGRCAGITEKTGDKVTGMILSSRSSVKSG